MPWMWMSFRQVWCHLNTKPTMTTKCCWQVTHKENLPSCTAKSFINSLKSKTELGVLTWLLSSQHLSTNKSLWDVHNKPVGSSKIVSHNSKNHLFDGQLPQQTFLGQVESKP